MSLRKLPAVLLSSILIPASLITLSVTSASAAITLTTCTNLANQLTIPIKATQKSCSSLLAPALWHLQGSDNSHYSGAGFAVIRICSSQNPAFTYQNIKSSCPKYQVTTDYWRAITPPSIPIVISSTAIEYYGAAFTLSAASVTSDAPIAYYLVTNIQSGQVSKISPNIGGQLTLTGLNPSTLYTFQISAVNVDGISPLSAITREIRTGAVPVALVEPAFTLSSSSEVRTAKSVATGFTISSSGGLIASFAVNATPPGMIFNVSTGALSGTPTLVASATTYTITATNAAGSTTQKFTLTVLTPTCAQGGACVVGDRGPGGGIVYYVSASNFTSNGSACGAACKYLEVAPSTWQSGGVSVSDDAEYAWPQSGTTGQNITTAGSESGFPYEKFNWKIGQGFYNTSLMGSAASPMLAAVLGYAGKSVAGQWFIPSMNELNELCKYARGQITGVLTVACTSAGTLKSTANVGSDLGGFVADVYWSSSEGNATSVWAQWLSSGTQTTGGKHSTVPVRPIRAF